MEQQKEYIAVSGAGKHKIQSIIKVYNKMTLISTKIKSTHYRYCDDRKVFHPAAFPQQLLGSLISPALDQNSAAPAKAESRMEGEERGGKEGREGEREREREGEGERERGREGERERGREGERERGREGERERGREGERERGREGERERGREGERERGREGERERERERERETGEGRRGNGVQVF